MKDWLSLFGYDVLMASSADEFVRKLSLIAEDELGFSYCAYGVKYPYPISKPNIAMVSNYPDEWQRRYLAQDFARRDPSVASALQSSLPIRWSDEMFVGAEDFWEEARSFGLCIGMAQSIRDATGAIGMLTLARGNDELTANEALAKRAPFTWLVQIAHVGFSGLTRNSDRQPSPLTSREREVLKWTADGKTAHEVGTILSISERTVNFHLNNIMRKLDVTGKVAAAVKAVLLGLIF